MFNYPEFYARIASMGFKKLVEVGVYRGDSLTYLAERLAKPFTLWGVDLWEKGHGHLGYKRQVDEATRHYCEERCRAFGENVVLLQEASVDAATMFEDQELDFVFIDANHAYQAVKFDIIAWTPKVRPGGIIAGHDYGEPGGVAQAVKELVPGFQVERTVWWVRT